MKRVALALLVALLVPAAPAAIGCAVANAIGVRVPTLPLTPDKVLAALEKGGMA